MQWNESSGESCLHIRQQRSPHEGGTHERASAPLLRTVVNRYGLGRSSSNGRRQALVRTPMSSRDHLRCKLNDPQFGVPDEDTLATPT